MASVAQDDNLEMQGVAKVLDAVAQILLEVDGIGDVKTLLFAPRTAEDFISVFKVPTTRGAEIKAWLVYLNGISELRSLPGFGAPLGSAFIGLDVEIRGLISGRTIDESHQILSDLWMKVIRKMLPERSLRGACLDREPLTVTAFDHITLGATRVATGIGTMTVYQMISGLEVK